MADPKREQVVRNFAAFMKMLPQLTGTQGGKFALMHDEEIVDFFDTARDAFVAGRKLFLDGLFSVQHVTDKPIDLGFLSHAVPG